MKLKTLLLAASIVITPAALCASRAEATISSAQSSVTLSGNGSSTAFSYPFIIPYQANGSTPAATVYETNTTTSVQTPLVLGTDYTISGINNPNGGTVTTEGPLSPLPAGNTITITRSLAYTQPTAVSNVSFYPHTVEQVADYITMQTQQLANQYTAGAVIGPVTSFNGRQGVVSLQSADVDALILALNGGTIDDMVIGNTTPAAGNFTRLNIPATITWSGALTAANVPLYLNETVSGTATSASLPIYAQGYTAPLNLINCAADTLHVPTTGGNTTSTDCLTVSHVMNTGFVGSRNGISSNLIIQGTSGNAGSSPFNSYYNGIVATAESGVNDGGTSLAASSGYLSGTDTQVTLTSGATYWSEILGGEDDVSVHAGASVVNKIGRGITLSTNDAVHGINIDAGLYFVSATGGTWNTGIQFGNPNATGGFPFNSTSSVMNFITPGGETLNLANGIDFSLGTFSGCVFKGPNSYCVENGGAVHSPSTLGTADVYGSWGVINAAATAYEFKVQGLSGTPANYPFVEPAVAGSYPIMGATGSDTNIGLLLQPKGAAGVQSSTFWRETATTYANLSAVDASPQVGDRLVISDASARTANAAVIAGGGTTHSCPVVYTTGWIAEVTH